jgi:hypothetical protein
MEIRWISWCLFMRRSREQMKVIFDEEQRGRNFVDEI